MTGGAALAVAGLSSIPTIAVASADPGGQHGYGPATATPIKHLVVIFQENVSFDHYFGTYPRAANLAGENPFHAAPGTPTVNGLSAALLRANPNMSNPQRLTPAQALTCDQDHGYVAEQNAFDHGLMDHFVQSTGHRVGLSACLAAVGNKAPVAGSSPDYAVMDYFDGNTVTGLWNYAQHFAMSDNSYGTTMGPSTPGALNVAVGNTYGAICGPARAVINAPSCSAATPPPPTPGSVAPAGAGTDYNDADPLYDACSDNATNGGAYTASADIAMGGANIGDLLDRSGVTWGWFQGGFSSPGYVPGRPTTDNLADVCTATHRNVGGATVTDYIPHHEPFQYFASTANPRHLPPTSVAMIGRQDQANHQYALRDFWAAADSGNLPAVSYLKAPAYQDGHAGYSDPTDEQHFLVDTINRLEKLPSWGSTAVVINYDDSDGWYDHQMGPVLTQSQSSLDTLSGTNQCGTDPAAVPMTDAGTPEQGRCGVGPRLPMMVISPWAKRNFVDNSFTDQTSVVRFVEDNWLGGQRIGDGNGDAMAGSLDTMFDFSRPAAPRLFLDPATGEPFAGDRA